MIKATDLRIGNLVSIDNEKHHPKLKNLPLQVTGMYFTTGMDDEPTHSITLNLPHQQPNRYNETYSQFIKYIRPIPLTPEILEKAGFRHRKHLNDFYKEINDDGAILILKDWCTMICGSNQQSISLDNRIFYVHQLQNLYFALTGHELEINLGVE